MKPIQKQIFLLTVALAVVFVLPVDAETILVVEDAKIAEIHYHSFISFID